MTLVNSAYAVRLRRIVGLSVLGVCAACGDKTPSAPAPASISIMPPEVNINRGTSLILSVVVKDAAGDVIDVAKPPALTFTSRKPAIVSVDETGRIEAISLGSAYVVADYKLGARTLEDSVSVTVAALLDRSPDHRAEGP